MAKPRWSGAQVRRGWLRGVGALALMSAGTTGTALAAASHSGTAGRSLVDAGWWGEWATAELSPSAELHATGTSAHDFFGASVAASGTEVVVGVPYLSGGRAYVFTEAAKRWRQVAALKGSDVRAGDFFGISVAVSGPTIVVGANGRDGGTGRAYVFARTARGWEQTAELSGPGLQPGDGFGSSVAVWGKTIVVGAPFRGSFSGVVDVFQRAHKGWRRTAQLRGSDTLAGDNFGYAVAVSSNNIVIGAPGHGAGTGRAYVFEPGQGGWRQESELKGADSVPGDNFGYSVAISGATLVAGASWHGSGTGAGYVFSRSFLGWRQSAELKGTGTVAGDTFGNCVAISGRTIVVGAPLHAKRAGEVYMFQQSVGHWRQVAATRGPDTVAGDAFGTSVAISGATVAIAASGHNDGRGTVYVLQESPSGT